MWDIVVEKLLDNLMRSGSNIIVSKAFDYAGKKYSEFTGDNDEFPSDEEINRNVIFDIIKLVNSDNEILNVNEDKLISGFIKTKLEEKNSFYKEIDLNVKFIEDVIGCIRYDVKCRYSLLEGLKNYPQIIKQKNSAIIKTICYNLKIKIDDEIKEELSLEIDVIRNIFELYKKGETTRDIFQQIYYYDERGFGFAFEFEIKQFIKLFEKIQ